LLRDLFEGAVAAIVKEQIALALHSPRPALHANSFEAAGLFIAAKRRELVDIKMHVAGNKKIHVPIAVVVPPCSAGAETTSGDSGFVSHVFKLAVA
jgi:hypothetical protein